MARKPAKVQRPVVVQRAMYKLKSEDGQVFETDRMALKKSSVFEQHLLANGIDDSNSSEMQPFLVPYPGIVIEMIIRWLNHHRDDRPRQRRTLYRDISHWDKEFLKVDTGVLFKMLNASHYLKIEELTHQGCAAAAELIRGKSTEEIRKIYGIKSEEEQMEEDIANGLPGPSGLQNDS
ncbi:unnamed protein product [Caenorhabditis sp. 36 PRJEB53466]|nr:unnamed protein product [Caenorhabditis sp. 36 PRJEB53466]